jgi:hypothetical protein
MALKPVFKRWNPELKSWHWGLMPEDFQKVMEGYACARCLEEFEFFVARCPVCGEENFPATVPETPSEWRS